MVVLALDTTTRRGSCAVARDGRVLREQAGDASRPQASRLPGELLTLLEAEALTLGDVDIFAVATGPGSFTGLRVGIATMQGLAFAAAKPLIGVSALDALAGIANAPRVATWVDAWRGEVFAALYVDGVAAADPVVAVPEDLLTAVPSGTLFIGDGAATFAEVIVRVAGPGSRIADPPVPLLAGTIAQLATAAADAGHCPPPHAIRPVYVRRPDAELARDARVAR